MEDLLKQKNYKAKVTSSEKDLLLGAIDKCIDDIWDHYDKDGNGFLDLHEARKFLRDIIRESGLYYGEDSLMEEHRVREAFLDIDTDNNRRISKDEMKEQLGKIIGIC